MHEEPDALKQKADEILKQMRADTSSKQHQDQAKIREKLPCDEQLTQGIGMRM